MFSSFSLENQINERLAALGCPLSFLIALQSEISESRARQGLTTGVKPLSTPQLQRLLDLVRQLERLVATASPLPVAYRQPQLFRELLRERGSE